MAGTKDMQRRKIRLAETVWTNSHPEDQLTSQQGQWYINKIARRKFISDRLPSPDSQIVLVSGSSSYSLCVPVKRFRDGKQVCEIYTHWDSKIEILHSFAHLIRGVTRTSESTWPSGAIHDVEFVKTFLDLVRRFYGDKADAKVMAEFKRCLLDQRVKTATRSPEAAQKSREIWYRRQLKSKADEIREALAKLRDS